MRLIVVPLSLKQSLVYCQRTGALPPARSSPRLDDRLAIRANKLWTQWQNSDTKWKKGLVNWSNKALERISYDEWSLKSVPARNQILRKVRMAAPSNDSVMPKTDLVNIKQLDTNQVKTSDVENIPVLYVKSLMSVEQVREKMSSLVHRAGSHDRKYFWMSLVASPFTLPVALLPVIPNVPGFYLLFRAWSHWKAMEGGAHLDYLLKDDHLKFDHTELLDNFYSLRLEEVKNGQVEGEKFIEDTVLLEHDGHIKELVNILEADEMESEIKRALTQIKWQNDKLKEEQQKAKVKVKE